MMTLHNGNWTPVSGHDGGTAGAQTVSMEMVAMCAVVYSALVVDELTSAKQEPSMRDNSKPTDSQAASKPSSRPGSKNKNRSKNTSKSKSESESKSKGTNVGKNIGKSKNRARA